MVGLELPWALRIERARRAWELRLGHREVVPGEEGHSLVAAGRVEGGIAGLAELDHMAAAAGEDTRHDEREGHRMELVVEVKERRSIPAAVEAEAGHSPVGEDSDPVGEGHHEALPEEHRIVAEGMEAVDSPEEAHHPEDSRRVVVLLK
jgi:hypothetical protein